MKQESKWIYRVTLTAVFAALVFVSSMISVPIPVAIGDVTRIHLAISSACSPALCWGLWAAAWPLGSALPSTT